MKKKIVLAVLGLVAVLGGGCSYYAVTDVGSGEVHYARAVRQHPGSRVATFKDVATGRKVTLPNAEVVVISEREFRAHARSGPE